MSNANCRSVPLELLRSFFYTETRKLVYILSAPGWQEFTLLSFLTLRYKLNMKIYNHLKAFGSNKEDDLLPCHHDLANIQ